MVGTVEDRSGQVIEAGVDEVEEVVCLLLHSPNFRDQIAALGRQVSARLDFQVDLVLTGHSSYPHAAKVNNTIISNTNAASCQYVRSLYGNSFNVVDIYENLINISEIHSLWGSRRILGIWKRNDKTYETYGQN